MVDWSRNEVEHTVKDYFDMFEAEQRGEPYNKTEHRRNLRQHLNGRTEAAIELKHQNISAVLANKGLPYINGYKPRGNYQALLAEIVMREAEQLSLPNDGQEYPFSSYSWVVHSPTVAVKQMDKSAFLHSGTGIPREIAFFFDFKPSDETRTVSLAHAGKEYEGHLSPDLENQRVRLFWRGPFAQVIEERMPGRYRHFLNDDVGETEFAEMRFVKKADNAYLVDFIEPVDIVADAVNFDEEPSGPVSRTEGTSRVVTSVQRERDPQNRLDAIRIHGHQCTVCGFDFGQVYGDWGDGYIEVHHLTPLADVDGEHEVNSETDLAPVCANCHRMIHRRRGKTLSIGELRKIIQ